MTERERLIELLKEIVIPRAGTYSAEEIADFMIEYGVRLPVLCNDCDFSSLWAGDGIDKQGKCFFLIGENQYVTPDGYCCCGTRRADNEAAEHI